MPTLTNIHDHFTPIPTDNSTFNLFIDNLNKGFIEADEKLFKDFELKVIHQYIKNSHELYMNCFLPKMDHSLIQLEQVLAINELGAPALFAFFKGFKKELIHHIILEDSIIIRYTENYLLGLENHLNFKRILIDFLNTHADTILLDLDKIFSVFEDAYPHLIENLPYRVFKSQFTLFQNHLSIHHFIEDEVYVRKIMFETDLHFYDN